MEKEASLWASICLARAQSSNDFHSSNSAQGACRGIDNKSRSCDTQFMATQTLHLTDEQAEVIRQMVANGGYDDASQVVDEALRLLQAQQDEQYAELDLLRAELQRGFDDLEAGRYIDLNSREDIDALGQRVIRRGLERLAAMKNVAHTSSD